LAAVLTVSLFTNAPVAHAETCAAHLASHGTTKDVDIAFHATHGGESPCKGEDKPRESRHEESKPSEGDNNKSDDESKSRYCRKHWYC